MAQVDAIAAGESEQNPKLALDVFLHATGQMGTSQQNCIVFEDAEAGVAAALAWECGWPGYTWWSASTRRISCCSTWMESSGRRSSSA